jgi:SAM-dependent methyltransferase
MDNQTRNRLNELNRAFYASTAPEFDQTRGRAWAGWGRLIPYVQPPLTVLDAGCGNGRFATFLLETLGGTVHYHGLDNSLELLAFARSALSEQPGLEVTLQHADLIHDPLPARSYDLVVLFGVIHHIPGAEQRQQFMRELAERVAPGGILCFASWRFYESERFRERIVPWEADWQVEAHDYLLDWRRGERALRYCHYVDDAEQEELIAATGLRQLETYRADGADSQLNCYSILKKIIKDE